LQNGIEQKNAKIVQVVLHLHKKSVKRVQVTQSPFLFFKMVA